MMNDFGLSCLKLNNLSTYLPTTSFSTLIIEPTDLLSSVVTSDVCGINDTVKLSSPKCATVRLTPSKATEPSEMIYF